MGASLCFKCIKTPKGCYVYDRYSGDIIAVSDDDYRHFKNYEEGKIKEVSTKVLDKYQKNGLILPHEIKEIKHPDSDYVQYLLDRRLSQLILQVTQQCNLRCSYCVYGGLYTNRVHDDRKMTEELAKRSIDFFLEHSTDTDHLVVSFYGGEPLLNMKLLEFCVNYISKNVDGKKIIYTITTNGTLLNQQIMEFLSSNRFHTMISLDGAKEEHDLNRKFKSGEGSFDIIMKNINIFKKNHPEYVKEFLQINAVISPKTKSKCVEEFFNTEDFLEDNQINFSPLTLTGLKEEIEIKSDYISKREYEYLKLLMFMLGKIPKTSVSKLVIESQGDVKRLYKQLKEHRIVASINHHSGPCIPGNSRLFINTFGDFYPCERVPEMECSCIGNINDGFYIDKVKQQLNIGKLTEEECKKCWAINLCSVCINQIDCASGCFTKSEKLSLCFSNKRAALRDLHELIAICEFGYDIGTEDY